MEGQCQCGAISFTTPTSKPLLVYICHCNECRRQSGSAFGMSAVFPKFSLPNSADLGSWTRITSAGLEKFCWFCQKCGVRLFHTGAKEKSKFVIVKAGVLGDELSAEMVKNATHIWAKQAVTPIPNGAERHDGDPPDD